MTCGASCSGRRVPYRRILQRGTKADLNASIVFAKAFDMGYVEGDEVAELKALYGKTGRTLNGYMRYVKSKIPLPSSGKDPEPESSMNPDRITVQKMPKAIGIFSKF